jgi:UDP:flavonoid glycosyltransferase YjiC (YdhE family)
MRVGLQGWGSEGDLRPVVALAAGLRRAGHEVRVDLTAVDGTDYTARGQALGLELRMLPERVAFALHALAGDAESVDPLKISRQLLEQSFFPYLEQLYDAALELCAASDVVVWHYSSWYTLAAARKTGTPSAALHLFPGLAPTRTAPPAGLPSLGPLNPLLWSAARAMLDLQFRKPPARFFAERGLPTLKHVLPDLLFSEQLNLHAMSPQLCPRPPDWSDAHQVCGALELIDDAEPWSHSPGLQAFLEDGPKPVLLSVGSMEHFAPRRARTLLIDAAREAKVRAIVQTKRTEEEGRDGALYFLPWAPHHALLPSCSLAVHHGGAGTSHSVLRAGLPAVVVPFILEQQLWGRRLSAVGAAAKPVPFWKATVQQLAGRIQEVSRSEALAARARALGAELRQENGVANAIALLSRIAAPRR